MMTGPWSASSAANSWASGGPVDGIAADPQYLDISIPAGRRKVLPVDTYRTVFAYVFEGSGQFESASEPFGVLTEEEIDGREVLVRQPAGNRSMVTFDTGDEIVVEAGEEGMRFSSRLGRTHTRTRRMAWPHRHEHAAGADRGHA